MHRHAADAVGVERLQFGGGLFLAVTVELQSVHRNALVEGVRAAAQIERQLDRKSAQHHQHHSHQQQNLLQAALALALGLFGLKAVFLIMLLIGIDPLGARRGSAGHAHLLHGAALACVRRCCTVIGSRRCGALSLRISLRLRIGSCALLRRAAHHGALFRPLPPLCGTTALRVSFAGGRARSRIVAGIWHRTAVLRRGRALPSALLRSAGIRGLRPPLFPQGLIPKHMPLLRRTPPRAEPRRSVFCHRFLRSSIRIAGRFARVHRVRSLTLHYSIPMPAYANRAVFEPRPAKTCLGRPGGRSSGTAPCPSPHPGGMRRGNRCRR